MRKPKISTSFLYKGQNINVLWYEVNDLSEIPNIPIQQVHGLIKIGQKFALVYDNEGKFSLPGGKTETGESIEQTLRREILEEMNCTITKWKPIGYQLLTTPDGKTDCQVRVVAEATKDNGPIKDPAMSVIGYKLMDLDSVEKHINHGVVGKRFIEIVRNLI